MTTSSFEVVASPLHDTSKVEALVAPLTARLERSGGTRTTPCDSEPHIIVVGTGGTEQAILASVQQMLRATPGSPILMVAHSKHNSLPAALEALARCRQLGHHGRIVFVDDDESDDQIVDAIADLATWHRLHTARLGLVGKPSDWLIASTPSAGVVRRRWGPELIDVAIPEALEAYQAVPVEVGRHVADRFGTSPAPSLPAPHDVTRAARLEPALHAIIESNALDAITVRCFDFLGSIETSGCLALAQLNDDGIVAGCEGDVPAALAMLWVRYLLDQPSWIANPASINIDDNQLTLAHCTIAPSMVDSVQLSSHFESGIGVGVHGNLHLGDVTLVRLGGADLDRCWIAEGSVVATGDENDLCRTQATITIDDRSVAELLDDPLGNHLVLVEGRHRQRLERWWAWTQGIPVPLLRPYAPVS